MTGLLALALAPAKLAMAQGKPQIVVRVEIASKAITDALPSPSAKAAAERTLAVQLSERARARFAFVEWKTVEDPGVPAIGYLVARLAEDTRDAMPAISVHWFAIRPSEAETELELAPVLVYKKNEPNVATSQQSLERDVKEAIDKVVPTSTFLDDLFTQFLSRVPLARSVTVLTEKRLFELPMDGKDLPIGQESVMAVEFDRPEATRKGVIELTHFASTDSGRLGASVNKAIVNSRELALTERWNATLPAVLQDTSVQCFIVKHMPDRSVPRIVGTPQ